MTASIHDHHIREFNVNASDRRIRLVTADPHSDGSDVAEVTFEGVEAYVIHGDTLGTILFEIQECEPLALYREYGPEMQRTYAATGGHAPWTSDDQSASSFLSKSDVRGYRIASSIGLEGAVWARRMSIQNIDADRAKKPGIT